jgi:hypothetical protein
VLFAVNVGAIAVPVASVVAVAVVLPPVNVPLAPLPGAVNVTTTPLRALPPLSFTTAFKGAKAVLITTLCGVPDTGVTLAGAPARFVKEKLAAVATPDTVAFTV